MKEKTCEKLLSKTTLETFLAGLVMDWTHDVASPYWLMNWAIS